MNCKRFIHEISPRVRLILDHNDPDTPAMVYARPVVALRCLEYSCTFDCALGTGYVGNDLEDYELTEAEWNDLDALSLSVDTAFEVARGGNHDYALKDASDEDDPNEGN